MSHISALPKSMASFCRKGEPDRGKENSVSHVKSRSFDQSEMCTSLYSTNENRDIGRKTIFSMKIPSTKGRPPINLSILNDIDLCEKNTEECFDSIIVSSENEPLNHSNHEKDIQYEFGNCWISSFDSHLSKFRKIVVRSEMRKHFDEKIALCVFEYLLVNDSGIKNPLWLISGDTSTDSIENCFSQLHQLISMVILFLHYHLPVDSFTIGIHKSVSNHPQFLPLLNQIRTSYENYSVKSANKFPFQILYDEEKDGAFITPSNDPLTKEAARMGLLVNVKGFQNSQENSNKNRCLLSTIQYLKESNVVVVFVLREDFLNDFESRLLTMLAYCQQRSNNDRFVFMITPNITKLPQPNSGRTEEPRADVLTVCQMKEPQQGNQVFHSLMNNIPISENISSTEVSTAEFRDMLIGPFSLNVTILCDIHNSLDHQRARRLENMLKERNLSVNIRFTDIQKSGFPDSTDINDLKKIFQTIENSQVIISIISPSFLNSLDCRLEHTLSLCYHTTSMSRHRLISFAVDDSVSENAENVNPVLKLENIYTMFDRDRDERVFLSNEAMTFIVREAIHIDGSQLSVKQHLFPTNKLSECKEANIFETIHPEYDLPIHLILCYDSLDSEKIKSLGDCIRENTLVRKIDESVRGTPAITEHFHHDSYQEVVVLYYVTSNFLDNLNNISTIYEAYLCLERCPKIRVAYTENIKDEEHIPIFIKRLPTIKQRTNESPENFNHRISEWIMDRTPNSQTGVLMEPPDCFAHRDNMNQLSIKSIEFRSH